MAFPALSEAKIDSIITLPGGSNGEVQFKLRGRFDGDPAMTFSTSTSRLTVTNLFASSGTVNGQLSVTDTTNAIFQKTFAETAFGPKGIVNWIKTNNALGSAGQYRIVVTTHSNLPLVGDGGQSQLRIYPPFDSTPGSIYFFVNGATKFYVDGLENTMSGKLDISEGGLTVGYGLNASTLTLTSLASKDCLGTDSDGNVIEGTCTGGGGGGSSYWVGTATSPLNMASFAIVGVSSITVSTVAAKTLTVDVATITRLNIGEFRPSLDSGITFTPSDSGLLISHPSAVNFFNLNRTLGLTLSKLLSVNALVGIGLGNPLRLGDSDSSNYSSFQSTEVSVANQEYVLPDAGGAADTVLATLGTRADGKIPLYWKTDATGAGGSGSPIAFTTGTPTGHTQALVSTGPLTVIQNQNQFRAYKLPNSAGATYYYEIEMSSIASRENIVIMSTWILAQNAAALTYQTIANGATAYAFQTVMQSTLVANMINVASGPATYVQFSLLQSTLTANMVNVSSAARTYVQQSSIAATSYLPTSVAAATYVTQSSVATTSYLPTSVFYSSAANTYPTISTVSTNYLSKSSASATYLQTGSAGDMILASSQTKTGWQNFTSPLGSTFTYGVVAASITVTSAGSGSLALGNSAGSNFVEIRGPNNISANYNIVVPSTAGSLGQILEIVAVDGSTVTTTWGDDGGGAGGVGDFVKASDNVTTGTNTMRGGLTLTSTFTQANVGQIRYVGGPRLDMSSATIIISTYSDASDCTERGRICMSSSSLQISIGSGTGNNYLALDRFGVHDSSEVANTAAEFSLYNAAIPASTLKPGRSLKIKYGGLYMNASGTSKYVTLYFSYGGVVFASSTAGQFASQAGWHAIDGDITIVSTGTQKQFSCGEINWGVVNTSSGIYSSFGAGVANSTATNGCNWTMNVNTDADQTLSVKGKMSAASANERMRMLYIKPEEW